MGSINLLSALKWVTRQPIHRGHPRLLFLLTGGAIGNTGKVLELLRGHSCSTRYRLTPAGPGTPHRLGCASPGAQLHLTDVPTSETQAGEIAAMSHGRTSKDLERIPEVQMLFKQSKGG